MRVLVCGGRKFSNKVLFRGTMNMIHADTPISMIIQGGSTGADWMAKYWAQSLGIKEIEFKAEWKKYGNSAGPRRNAEMLDKSEPDLVVAFPGNDGTADMVKKARAAGYKVFEVPNMINHFDSEDKRNG